MSIYILTCGFGVYMSYMQPVAPLKFHVIMVYIYMCVTGSTKTGLITQDRKFDFFTQTQSLINALSNFTVTVNQRWSAFVGCFFKAQWRAVWVAWGLDGALTNQEMAVCGCTALWCWTMTCKFPFILASSEP